ncbi:MAG: class I SAM-dependent methyltransferase [Anaerolineales bacterium]|nr:MAG: class I SAM-dependent methyltransferase [Anaerolineales bacterium]
MSDDVSDIAAYYNTDPEREHQRLDRHQLEYELTWRYLDEYLPSQGSILEVGAATGKYTLQLAKRGHAVTAVDMSAALVEECRKNIIEAGLKKQVRFLLADARNLGEVRDREFDAVLLMGPLYHLIEESDRKKALKEAYDHVRGEGLIFSTFISRFGIMGDLLKDLPNWIEQQAEVRSLLESGKRPDGSPRGGFRGYFAQISEIIPLHETIGFETLKLAGVEPAISADDESYNKLQGKQRQLWLNLLYELSTQESILGASRHILYIGKKKVNSLLSQADNSTRLNQ